MSAPGYSGTPLARKLGIKPESRLALLNVPPAVWDQLHEAAPGVTARRRLGGRFDVILACFTARLPLERRLPALVDALTEAGGLWLAWPKRASGVVTDLGEPTVRELGLATGLVDNKVCAVDEVFGALRFVRRLRDRGPLRGSRRATGQPRTPPGGGPPA